MPIAEPADVAGMDAASRPKVRVARKPANWLLLALGAATLLSVTRLKSGPQAAQASLSRAQSSVGGSDDPAGTDLAGIRKVDRALSDAGKYVSAFLFVPSTVQVPLMELKVNPFRLNGTSQPALDAADEAESQHREQERQSALQAVQLLQLQSIIHGGARRECLINGVRYQEGQEAGDFLVEQIASTTVVVRKGVYRFELKLSM